MKNMPMILGAFLVANLAFMAGGALADRGLFQQYADAYTLVDQNGTALTLADQNGTAVQVPPVPSWRAPRTSSGYAARCVAIVGTGISCYQEVLSR